MTICLNNNKKHNINKIPKKNQIKKLLKEEKYSIEEISKKLKIDKKIIINIAKKIWGNKKEKKIDKISLKLQIKEEKIKPFIVSFKYKHKKFDEEFVDKNTIKINRRIIQTNPHIKLIEENELFFKIKIEENKLKIDKNSTLLFAFEDFLKIFSIKDYKKYFDSFYKKWKNDLNFKREIKKMSKKEIISHHLF
ncbi:hypothetical protein [Caminibacter mediatlanticus]|uniref:Uncharacterized protein n=1 Tax=Caminibacter mediatlanticus TB-2 TaxID=391592 RepID=A0AAI9AG74_9BACT|nr:hypothetical protein [Caminibacter mediatlanticus]EDM22914.1 hypothetical protein CMTB2_05482 [Caminibacter mediatlanticus TB-2]